MKALLRVIGWIVLFGSLTFGAWLAWPLIFPPQQPGVLSRLAKADSALLQGQIEKAKGFLQPWPEALSAGQWLQWQKRVRTIVLQTKDWKWAQEAAAKAAGQYPGNADLAAFRVWVLLKSGAAAEAQDLGEKVLAHTRWEPLLVQARIEAGLLDKQTFPAGWTSLREALASPGTPDLYAKLTALDPDPTLKKNALLDALASGRLDVAQTYLSALTPAERDRPPFDRLQALLAYDEEDWVRSAALLRNLASSDPSTHQILADVYLHLGELEQARIIYDQILADNSAGIGASGAALSPALYLNRATIALNQQDPGTALTILNRALMAKNSLSESDVAMTQLRLLLLEARFGLGEQGDVRKQLDTILASSEESPYQLQAELLKDRLFPEMESVPRLWSLLHRHPDSAPLVERLVWVLILQKDYPSAHKALDLYLQKNPEAAKQAPWWYSSYLAMLLSLENDLDGGLRALDAVPNAWRDYTYFANVAQVQTVFSRSPSQTDKSNLLENALENDAKALDLLPSGTGRDGLLLRSRLLTHRGAVHWALVAYQKPGLKADMKNQALDDLSKAVQLDPENLRAAFLLRQATSLPLQEKP